MRKALDSFFGFKKHHLLMKKDTRSTLLLKEFVDHRNNLVQMGKEGVFNQSKIFPLKYCVRNKKNKNYNYCNIWGVAPTVNYARLPLTAAWVEEFAKEQNGVLGWFFVSILEPKSQVLEHSDNGLYFSLRDRYHFVLQSDGSEMLSGGDTVIYKEGELWWFNNRVPHKAFNESEQERIHIIFDILPNSLLRRLKNFMLWIYWGLRPKRLWRYYFGRKFPQF